MTIIITTAIAAAVLARAIYWLDDFDRYAGTDIEPAPRQRNKQIQRDREERARGVGFHGSAE